MPDLPIDDIPIAEELAHEFEIGEFAESAVIDLRATLGQLGVDIEAIEKAPKCRQQLAVLHAMQTGGDISVAKHMGRFPQMKDNSAWVPFSDGYVVVAGRLEFDAADADGAETHYSLPIRARVFMFHERYDQPMPPSYQYSAELEPSGKNYGVPIKLSQALKAGDADRFTIRLSCARSAFHEFRVRWNFVGGLSCTSYPIRLQHFVPRTFAAEASETVQDGKFDEERDVQPVFEGTA